MPMKNDIAELAAPFGPYDIAKLADSGLDSLRVDRREAELWAIRDCKFLIFDDTLDPDREYDSDDPEDMLEYALNLSLQNDDQEETLDRQPEARKQENSVSSSTEKGKQVASTNWARSETEEESSLTFFGNVHPHYGPSSENSRLKSAEFQCAICSKCPEFPHNRKTRKFRLFRPRDEFPELFDKRLPRQRDICPHYVAVSYCWPPQQTDIQGNLVETARNYTVRDLDGTIRPNRALDDVLDRAVDVANTFGLRMIWIDQECLPQPPQDTFSPYKEDKELGIQAMDIVYNRAFVTAGLQDVKLSDQTQLDTILKLASDANKGGRPKCMSGYHELGLIVDFLDRVSRDRWYTRAWVIQEAISAGDNLSLVFRRGPDILCSSQFRMANDRRGLPEHSLESERRDSASEIICIMVHEFRHIVEAAKLFLQQTAFSHVGEYLVLNVVTRPAEKVVRAAELLHPVFWKPQHFNFKFAAFGINIFGIRPTTDAAGALTLLKSRQCSYNEDRIAIMANMCGYELRYSPKAMAEYCDSLRVALLALSMLNGDMSLLVPEAYSDTRVRDDMENQELKLLRSIRPGWIHPFDIDSRALHQVTVRGFNIPRTQARDRARGAVRIPAYFWKVDDRPIDMFPIKVQWDREWARLKCLKTAVHHIKGEDEEAFQARTNAIYQHVEKRDVMDRIKHELWDSDSISNDSPIWDGINHYAGTASFNLILLADRVEAVPGMQKVVADIFFGILRFLMGQADQDTRAQGVANSIWQSVGADMVPGHPELPDVVSEDLFQHPAIIKAPFQAMKWDRDREGGYYQVWLIDRIMMHGNLYAGCYEPERTPATGADGGSKIWSISDAPEPGQEYWERLAQEFRIRKSNGSSLDRQKQRLMRMYAYAADDFSRFFSLKNSEEGQVGLPSLGRREYPSPGAMAGFTERIAREVGGETEAYRAEKYAAVFDVDGPCTVAIPFDAAWEMIPHPTLRSMSACWVVEVSKLPTDVVKNTIRTDGGDSRSKAPGENGRQNDPATLIRVLDKVRGMWPVMDIPPWENYVFW